MKYVPSLKDAMAQNYYPSFFLLLILALSGCGRPSPKSQLEFIEAYRSAYDAGDKTAVLALVKWDGVPDVLRESCEWFLTFSIGSNRISSIELIDYEPDPNIPQEIEGRKLKSNLEPRYWLIAKTEGHNNLGPTTSSVKWAVGVENGVFRFCG